LRVDPRFAAGGLLLLSVAALSFSVLRSMSFKRPVLQRAAEALRALPLRALVLPFAVALVVHAGNLVVYVLLESGLHLGLPLPAVIVFYVVTSLAAAAPISLGGLGVRELAGAIVLRPFGFPADAAVALGLLWTASATIWALAGGVLFTRSTSVRSASATPHSPVTTR
jgi:uncharacterized membrane protein YbhN (UPF0104 family)